MDGRPNGWTEGGEEGRTTDTQTDRQTDSQTDRGIEQRKGGVQRNRVKGREKGKKERKKEQGKNGKGTIYLHLVPIFPNLIQRNMMYIMKCLSLAKIKTTILIIRAQKVPFGCPGQVDFPIEQVTFILNCTMGLCLHHVCVETQILTNYNNN